MVSEFIEGREVPEIAARYGVAEAYVDRVIEQTDLRSKRRWDWSLNNWGNRLLYCVLLALAISAATTSTIGWVTGAVVFVLASAIVSARRS